MQRSNDLAYEVTDFLKVTPEESSRNISNASMRLQLCSMKGPEETTISMESHRCSSIA